MNANECRICFVSSKKKKLVELKCHPCYCPVCISLWQTKNNTCPTCRQFFILSEETIQLEPYLVFLEFSQRILKRSVSALEVWDNFWQTVQRYLHLSNQSKRFRKRFRKSVLNRHEKLFKKLLQYRHVLDSYHESDFSLREMKDFCTFIYSLYFNPKWTAHSDAIFVICFLFMNYFYKMKYHFGHSYQEHYQLFHFEKARIQSFLKERQSTDIF